MLVTTLIFCAVICIISNINNKAVYYTIKKDNKQKEDDGYYEFEKIRNRIYIVLQYLTNTRDNIKIYRCNNYLMTINADKLLNELTCYIMLTEDKLYEKYQLTTNYSLPYILSILLATRYNKTIKYKDIQLQSDIDKISFMFSICLDADVIKNYAKLYTDVKYEQI